MQFIGPHISTAKGYAVAAREAVAMGANVFQFFSRNPRGSNFRSIRDAEVTEFHDLLHAHGFGPLQAHAPYTLNLASPDERVYEFGCRVVQEDVARMNDLKIPYFVFHPGNHLGAGIEAGIERIAEALNSAITGTEQITVLLETMSGKGTEIGARFEELRRIVDLTEHSEKLGVCMDVCHVFSAGYDIKGDLDDVLDRFDRAIGIARLKSIHLNDSLFPIGSRKDRHTPIGEGAIGTEAILNLMRHPALSGLPFYLETPLDSEGHKREIDMLKSRL
jgi:deoxyribonuclease-4